MFKVSELNYAHMEDENGNEDPNRCLFYFGDYFGDNNAFMWLNKGIWNDNTLDKISPIIQFSEPYNTQLNSLFGDKWKPIFLERFNKYYPQYKAKTVFW